jgi:methylmalonyl-CoA mutase
MGGMAKAIAAGMPKMRFEESSARKQARIDQGKDIIVGVNKYQVKEDREIDVLEVSSAVRDEQVARLKEIRATRNETEVKRALEALTNCAAQGGNLLEVCVPAMRARATVGEVSDAIEKVFGRYVATTQCISGAFAAEYGESEVIEAIRKRTADFAERNGRRPRILVTKMGQDGHDRGYKLISSAYADLGFDVDISPMFQTPAEAARMAIENDVHVVGVSSLAAGHKYLVPEIRKELDAQGGREIFVVVGGIIPPKDYELLLSSGAVAIFGPGTPVIESANKVLNILEAL